MMAPADSPSEPATAVAIVDLDLGGPEGREAGSSL